MLSHRSSFKIGVTIVQGTSQPSCDVNRLALDPMNQVFLLWKITIFNGKTMENYGKSQFLMGKLTISMAIFHSKLLVYQINHPLISMFNGKTHYKWPFSIANC